MKLTSTIEQKKRECWEEYLAFNDEKYSKSAFSYAFDRAYALGREKEPISQEDIEKAAQEHADELRVSPTIPGALMPMLHDIAKSSYLQGAQDFIGTQEKDAEGTSLWERLTDREKHNLRRHYHRDECVVRDHKKLTGDKAQTRATTRMRLLENLFGKDNINPCDDE